MSCTSKRANYKSKGKWFAGKISRANSDGTFDVAYDDGDSERRVARRNVRVKGGSSKKSTKGGKALRKGTRVEARFMGGRRYYPGKISAENADGTFSIAYDVRDDFSRAF